MEILFIVDEVEDIERKIAQLENFGEIKFFVNANLAPQIIKNKYIVSHMVSIYNNNVNKTIDEYVKSSDYKPTETLLYYASVELTSDIMDKIMAKLQLKPDTIYVKKKLGWWSKFKLWFYHKIIKVVFGMTDEYASTKLQYFSAELMNAFAKSNFKNHIFTIKGGMRIELEKGEESSYYPKSKFNKNYLYNPIVFCLILICYVVLERFLNLPFWVYFLVIAMLLATVINLIIMIVKNTFDCRYKK